MTVLSPNQASPAIATSPKFWNTHAVSKKTKTILKGMVPIIGVALVLVIFSLLANQPGLTGEIFAKILGIMFTPIFMECSLAFLGLIALLWVNHVRLKAEGDDYVTLEIEDESDNSRS
jgi:hypothetical protein